MNWGKGVVIAFVCFISMIIVMIILAVRGSVQLVTDDYYEQELVYQDKINATVAASVFVDSIIVSRDNKFVTILFPAGLQAEKGEIYFYRPSDASLDKKFPLEIQNNREISFNVNEFAYGKYTVKLSWQYKNESFYCEKEVFI
ncbi:MAG: FixH family protein [Chitinophagales bacterium]